MTALNIRWIQPRDYGPILRIEQRSFQYPWSYMDFWKCLDSNRGVVVEINRTVVGYLIYGFGSDKIDLINLAVTPVCRRCGLGSLLITILMSKLLNGSHAGIEAIVREKNLVAQMFLASPRHKFRCIDILHNFYSDSPEDAYLMWCGKPGYRPVNSLPSCWRAHKQVQLLSL